MCYSYLGGFEVVFEIFKYFIFYASLDHIQPIFRVKYIFKTFLKGEIFFSRFCDTFLGLFKVAKRRSDPTMLGPSAFHFSM